VEKSGKGCGKFAAAPDIGPAGFSTPRIPHPVENMENPVEAPRGLSFPAKMSDLHGRRRQDSAPPTEKC
jgi:hypothetical protein